MHEKLYLENRGLLWYWANHYAPMCRGRGDVDAEDLVQDGFFALLEASESWREDRGSWSTWASFYIRKAMRKTLGLSGKQQLQTMSLDIPVGENGDCSLGDLIPDASLPDSDALLLMDDLTRAVRQAVDAIRNEQPREAIRRVYLDGLSYAEAAREMGTSLGAMKNLLKRGCTELRRNYRLRQALPELDEYTLFIRNKGVGAFMRDHTSVVEAAVIWREEQAGKPRIPE